MSALRIVDLHKTYSNGVTALKGVNLDVAEGDFFALLGPNGAGKSTTIGIICSLVNKTDGRVEIFGTDLEKDASTARMHIGLVPQEFNFNVFEPIGEILINQAGYYGIDRATALPRAENLLKDLDLWSKRNDMARELSGGMKRRLMIARALMHEPKLLILDEPTASVDIEIRRSMWDYLTRINEQGTTIILTTHYLEEAENLCNNIAIIDEGITIESTSMRELLDRLHTETFILYTESPVASLPDFGDYTVRLKDETTIEVDVRHDQNMNRFFSSLSDHGIEIDSMRNKSNRLEQLFVSMLHGERQR